MKHIIFNFVEPIVAIQRVRNEVFTGDTRTIVCYNPTIRRQLFDALRDLQVKCKLGDSRNIILLEDYRISLDKSNFNEFYVVKGEFDSMTILDPIDYYKED